MAAWSDHAGQAEQLVTIGRSPARAAARLGLWYPPLTRLRWPPEPILFSASQDGLRTPTHSCSQTQLHPGKDSFKSVFFYSFILHSSPQEKSRRSNIRDSSEGSRMGLGQVLTTRRRGVLKMSRCQLGRGGCEEMFWHSGPHLRMHLHLQSTC